MKYTITLDKIATYFNSSRPSGEEIGFKLNGEYNDNCMHVESLFTENINFKSIPKEIEKLLAKDGVENSNWYIDDNYLEFDDVVKLPYFDKSTPEQEYAVTLRLVIQDSNGNELDAKQLETIAKTL
ncbi:hypothetical protein [Shouchella clausii]|uniref:hypothetical protein n=1 Tax=Shouchella clausii TaxID=79880 RepID=UPI001C72C0E9|nr:hypothetical protein [Shouchella clausii]MBX0320151.1 hypothetical protein [Shouchella clausii]MEB5480835.1 hypothetical protein [Shouchella clausii]